ncbi:MAG: type II secretion system F family protein [Pirellulales bacterium]|nr:type II secretion system F family protein [Pirellulales bacterium]
MPDFAYTARNSIGEEIVGRISAATEREALGLLSERALFPLRVARDKPARVAWTRPQKVKPYVLATTLGQLGDLLKSGVPLLRAFELLGKQAANPVLADVLADVRNQLSEGTPLDAALAKHPAVFNELTISMVRAGAEGGFLEEVLERTSAFIEQQEDLKSRVVGAATYPVLLAIVGFVAVTLIIVFMVPKFAELFARLEERGELPSLTTGLLWTSAAMKNYGLFLLAGAIGGFVFARRQMQTERGRLIADQWKIKLPAFGGVILSLAVARFCRVLGTLLKNGVPILRALEISSGSTGNKVLASAVRSAASNISSGQSLAKPLAASGLFPRSVVEMISVAEEANNLENVLINIADGLERRTHRQLDLAVRLLEPAMLLVMGSIILVVVLALLLPVFQMSTMV